MSFAETQDEIIRSQLRGRPPASRPAVSVLPLPAVRATRRATPAARAVVDAPAAASPGAARPVATPATDDGADADLAAAVAAARRLRFTAEVEQIVGAAGVTVVQIQGHGKSRALVEVRRIVAAYLRRRGCSLPEIGHVLNRDHTSVLHLLRTPPRESG
jgi:hypothetical protein